MLTMLDDKEVEDTMVVEVELVTADDREHDNFPFSLLVVALQSPPV